MRLILRKDLNFVNPNNRQSFRKYLRQIDENEYKRTFHGFVFNFLPKLTKVLF